MESLKNIRTHKSIKLSLRKLGEQAGVSYVTLARIEAGIYDPRLSTLRKVAKALGKELGKKITVAHIIGDQPLKPKGDPSYGTHKTKGRVVR